MAVSSRFPWPDGFFQISPEEERDVCTFLAEINKVREQWKELENAKQSDTPTRVVCRACKIPLYAFSIGEHLVVRQGSKGFCLDNSRVFKVRESAEAPEGGGRFVFMDAANYIIFEQAPLHRPERSNSAPLQLGRFFRNSLDSIKRTSQCYSGALSRRSNRGASIALRWPREIGDEVRLPLVEFLEVLVLKMRENGCREQTFAGMNKWISREGEAWYYGFGDPAVLVKAMESGPKLFCAFGGFIWMPLEGREAAEEEAAEVRAVILDSKRERLKERYPGDSYFVGFSWPIAFEPWCRWFPLPKEEYLAVEAQFKILLKTLRTKGLSPEQLIPFDVSDGLFSYKTENGTVFVKEGKIAIRSGQLFFDPLSGKKLIVDFDEPFFPLRGFEALSCGLPGFREATMWNQASLKGSELENRVHEEAVCELIGQVRDGGIEVCEHLRVSLVPDSEPLFLLKTANADLLFSPRRLIVCDYPARGKGYDPINGRSYEIIDSGNHPFFINFAREANLRDDGKGQALFFVHDGAVRMIAGEKREASWQSKPVEPELAFIWPELLSKEVQENLEAIISAIEASFKARGAFDEVTLNKWVLSEGNPWFYQLQAPYPLYFTRNAVYVDLLDFAWNPITGERVSYAGEEENDLRRLHENSLCEQIKLAGKLSFCEFPRWMFLCGKKDGDDKSAAELMIALQEKLQRGEEDLSPFESCTLEDGQELLVSACGPPHLYLIKGELLIAGETSFINPLNGSEREELRLREFHSSMLLPKHLLQLETVLSVLSTVDKKFSPWIAEMPGTKESYAEIIKLIGELQDKIRNQKGPSSDFSPFAMQRLNGDGTLAWSYHTDAGIPLFAYFAEHLCLLAGEETVFDLYEGKKLNKLPEELQPLHNALHEQMWEAAAADESWSSEIFSWNGPAIAKLLCNGDQMALAEFEGVIKLLRTVADSRPQLIRTLAPKINGDLYEFPAKSVVRGKRLPATLFFDREKLIFHLVPKGAWHIKISWESSSPAVDFVQKRFEQ